jgi:hypothetical protein
MRPWRRTQVVKGAVCKTAMQRFDPARRLQSFPPASRALLPFFAARRGSPNFSLLKVFLSVLLRFFLAMIPTGFIDGVS